MYENPIVQDNISTLKDYGMEVVTPASGYLACGDTGEGKMPEPEVLYEAVLRALTPKDLSGRKVLVTAGPTQEKLDPVRYISNHSTGKMGYAVAVILKRTYIILHNGIFIHSGIHRRRENLRAPGQTGGIRRYRMLLKEKHIVLGVTGSIAAYKMRLTRESRDTFTPGRIMPPI